jgi:hypothetical protein
MSAVLDEIAERLPDALKADGFDDAVIGVAHRAGGMEDTTLANHGQTLARLAERGGLSPVEIGACHTRAPLRSLFAPNTTEAAVPELLKLLASLPLETS